jgi:DnaJ-class molecular chaperone
MIMSDKHFDDFIDYFAVLGITSEASPTEIKVAYRRALRLYHPDLHPNNPSAHEITKTVIRAYNTLINEQDRAEYWRRFQMIQHQASVRRPVEQEVILSISLQQAFYGTEESVNLPSGDMIVRIPPGVDTGDRLQVVLPDKSKVFLTVIVKPDKWIRRDGPNLHLEHPVTLITAILGGEIGIQFFDEELIVRVPPGTSSEKPLRLHGKGMPTLNGNEKRGDLFVRLLIRVPEKLSGEALAKFKEFAEAWRNTQS